MRKINYMLIASVAVLTGAAPAFSAGEIFAPVSGVIDDGGPGFGTLAETINQAGLSINYVSGVTNFDSYMALNPTHTFIFAGNEWFSNEGITSAVVTYDFGSVKTFDKLALWNEESSGIGTLNLLTSVDGLTFTPLATVFPTDNPLADYSADIYSFSATTAQFVRFAMSDCPQPDPGSFVGCAIGEVAFRSAGAVPEPASWALMIGGFGLLGGALRRRAAGVALA